MEVVRMKRLLVTSTFLGLFFNLVACGPTGTNYNSSEISTEMEAKLQEPTAALEPSRPAIKQGLAADETPSEPETTQPAPPPKSSSPVADQSTGGSNAASQNTSTSQQYRFSGAKSAANLDEGKVAFEVEVHWGNKSEIIKLQGNLKSDWTADLKDTNPKNGRDRLAATAVCIDYGTCYRIFVDVYYVVNHQRKRIQFVPNNSVVVTHAPLRSEETNEPHIDDGISLLDHGSEEGDDNPLTGKNTAGEYVGVPNSAPSTNTLISLPETANDEVEKIEDMAQPPAPDQVGNTSSESAAQQHEPSTNHENTFPVVPPPEKPNKPITVDLPAPIVGDVNSQGLITSFTNLKPLNLTGGGQAIDQYNDGEIYESSELPKNGVGFRQAFVNSKVNFGAGMTIEYIKKAAMTFADFYENSTFVIGQIAKKRGGGVAHNSHQNGLDIDIMYLDKNQNNQSLANGKLREDFDYERNWNLFRMFVSQTYKNKNGESSSVVNRIFISHTLKNKGFCVWAKKNNILNNPLDKEVMARLQPWDGHSTHFHVRLKCSPYYARCQDQADPMPSKTACP